MKRRSLEYYNFCFTNAYKRVVPFIVQIVHFNLPEKFTSFHANESGAHDKYIICVVSLFHECVVCTAVPIRMKILRQKWEESKIKQKPDLYAKANFISNMR